MRIDQFQYGDIKLREAVTINHQPYFTRQAIGEWLEYEESRKAIGKIIERNPHIENPQWATVVKLTSVEGERLVEREVAVYNPIGLQLIIFESRKPKAIEYKIAVAKLVADMASGVYFRNYIQNMLDNMEPWVPKYKRRKKKLTAE